MPPISLSCYLLVHYLSHFSKPLPSNLGLRCEVTRSKVFEIRDNCTSIVQSQGAGVSVFSNPQQTEVQIVDFEEYIKGLKTGQASEGPRCDFIIVPTDTREGEDFIILNELTETEPKYLTPFTKPTAGEQKIGKLAEARDRQLTATIDKLSHASGVFLSQFSKRIALFSYRLPQNSATNNLATESLNKFLSPTQANSNISMPQALPHGFTFEQRIYPESYVL